VIRRWEKVLRTGSLPEDAPADPVSRWLVITRAPLLSLSLFAGIIGGLLATLDGSFRLLPWLLALLWLVLAQAVNLLINDLFDTQQGIDTEEYARVVYAPHPLFHRLTGRGGLTAAILLLFALDLAVVLALARAQSWPVLAFAAAVFLLNLASVAPPLKLKQRGLGELAQLLLWGPVMTGGAYFAAAGDLPGRVWPATLPYGIAVAGSLLALYLDRRGMDETRWVLTLPVLIGEQRTRTLLQLTVWGYYLLVTGLAATDRLPWCALLTLVSLPGAVRFLAALQEPGQAQVPGTSGRAGAVSRERGLPPRNRGFPPPPPPGRLTVGGRRWLAQASRSFAAGLLAAAVLKLLRDLV